MLNLPFPPPKPFPPQHPVPAHQPPPPAYLSATEPGAISSVTLYVPAAANPAKLPVLETTKVTSTGDVVVIPTGLVVRLVGRMSVAVCRAHRQGTHEAVSMTTNRGAGPPAPGAEMVEKLGSGTSNSNYAQ